MNPFPSKRGQAVLTLACWLGAIAALAASAAGSPVFHADPQDSGQVHAWVVGRLWNGVAPPVENAVVLVRNGRILAAGARSDIAIPLSATVHDHSSEVMIPGLVIAETPVGQAAAGEQAVTPWFLAADGLDLFEQYPRLLAAGITTVHVNPGTQRLMPGRSAVVKLHGSPENRLLNDDESLQIILSSAAWNPPTVYEPPVGAMSGVRPLEPTRPQLAGSLAEAVSGLRALLDSSRLELPAGASSQDRAILGAIAPAPGGALPTRWTARSAAEIVAAARLAADYRLKAVLVDPKFLGTVLGEETAAPFAGYILFPTSMPGGISNVGIPDEDAVAEADEFWESARLLRDRGIDAVALGGMTAEELESILLHASLLKRAEIDEPEILSMVTSSSAGILGVGDRVGSLESGKDADFVLLTGNPFDRGTQVVETWVGGEPAFSGSRPAPPEARPSIVRGGSIHTPNGVISGGSVVVAGSRIAAVGTDVSLPPDAVVHDFSAAVIVPGMIDLNCSVGMGAAFGDAVPLNRSLAGQLVSEDRTVRFVRQSGVTTALVGSTRMPTPVIAFKLTDRPRAVRDPAALRFDVSGNLTSVESTIRRTLAQGKAYAAGWTKYEQDFAAWQKALQAWEAEMKKIADAKAKAEAEAEAKAAAEARAAAPGGDVKPDGPSGSDAQTTSKPAVPAPESGGPPSNPGSGTDGTGSPPQDANPAEAKPADAARENPADAAGGKAAAGPDGTKTDGPPRPAEPEKPRLVEAQEPWREVFAGRLPLIAVAQQPRAIELAVRLFVTEFDLPVIIAGAEDADLALEVLRNPKVSVAIGPQLTVRRDTLLVNLPQQLATAGIPFGFQSGAASGSGLLPAAVAAATYRGLGPGDAVRAFSSSPAGFLKLGSLGSLAAGQDADLVVLSGPPFDLGTEVLAVMIDGQWVFRKESQ